MMGLLKKKIQVYVFLALTLLFAGCALLRKDHTVSPDDRAGRNLVIYFAENRDTLRAARRIAKITGGELFDIAGKKPLPDVLDYETFFVGSSVTAGRVAASMEDFLARTDFMDGRVIPFWTSAEEGDFNRTFENLIQGERFLRGGGFPLNGRMYTKRLEEMAEAWTEVVLVDLGLRRAAGGDYAEDMVKLFYAAYKGRFSPPIFKDGDWTLEMDGVRWYYAQGRFLPQKDRERPKDFRPQFLYRYSPEPHDGPSKTSPWQDAANQLISRRQSSASYSAYRPDPSAGAARSPFFESIWQGRSRAEAFSHQQRIAFLGFSVQVHRDIVSPLSRVEARIEELAKTETEIQDWLGSLHSITGWNWRNVAGSETRSFHAYGAAVDLLMKARAGMETYWQWTAAKGIDWRTVPVEKLQNPPAAVIRAFEEEGFIWGGRWRRYDTMHFEYHPELLILGTGRDDGYAQTPSRLARGT
ncbi:MAG: M15 family metallopeptidase [Spirochaetaceae bacterium]|nr:M15 family metallopeptidase [Spirochaetaceae bacterium]